jgi:hypothetical protein
MKLKIAIPLGIKIPVRIKYLIPVKCSLLVTYGVKFDLNEGGGIMLHMWNTFDQYRTGCSALFMFVVDKLFYCGKKHFAAFLTIS